MNYQLAKKLKDDGFPQSDILSATDAHFARLDEPYFPSLSELIDACGGVGIVLRNDIGNLDSHLWTAGALTKSGESFKGTGQSPETAFANLWLELHKLKPDDGAHVVPIAVRTNDAGEEELAIDPSTYPPLHKK